MVRRSSPNLKPLGHRLFFGVLSLFGLGGLFLFQNCADVDLSLAPAAVELPIVVSQSLSSRVPVPVAEVPRSRLVVILDQSFSMAWGKCPSDLDGSNPSAVQNGLNSCPRPDGVDPHGLRFDLVESWIAAAENAAADGSDAQIMILPLSGGAVAQRPHPDRIHPGGGRDLDYMKFLSPSQARIWLDILRREHQLTRQNVTAGLMGTTVFEPLLDYSFVMLQEELQRMRQNAELLGSQFDYVVVSDGVFKPNQALYQSMRTLSGCPDCQQNPAHIACRCNSPSQKCWSGPVTPGEYCQSLNQNFRLYFGEPSHNDPESIRAVLNEILSLPERDENRGIRLQMRSVRLSWDRVPLEDKNIPGFNERNLFLENIEALSREVRTHSISGAEQFFSLAQPREAARTYYIQNLYVIHRNAFVDEMGKLVIDSDGDGVSDTDEMAIGTDPQNPRSNGICLDGLAQAYGCQSIGCNPTLDQDGDGLNQCEEISVGTQDSKFDSDLDGIPDYFEVLRGLNPLADDKRNYRFGSMHSDHDKFRLGVLPGADMARIPKEFLLQMRLNLQGFISENNAAHSVASYETDLRNIPLVAVQSVPTQNILALQKTLSGPSIASFRRLDTLSKTADSNEILFVMQISSFENPMLSSWHIWRENISIEDRDLESLKRNFDLRRFVQVKGEEW